MPKKPRTTARFWVNYGGGLVAKVKLRPGQTAWHFDRTDNGEGITTICRSWHFHTDGSKVTLAWVKDGTDCDGRMTSQGMSECAQRDLMSGYASPDRNEGVRYPRWMPAGVSSQRDYAAEAMGY